MHSTPKALHMVQGRWNVESLVGAVRVTRDEAGR